MAQYVKNANIFGRLGSGIGQGLAEQVPKEIEHQRLRSGLQSLAQKADAGNLSPAALLAEAAGTYGITPQAVQSFGELGKQQARGQALIQSQNRQQQPALSPFARPEVSPQEQGTPSITKPTHLEKAQEGYIPKTQDEIFQNAGQKFNENPALFNNDPQKAIDAAEKEDFRNQQINEAHQTQHAKLTAIQDSVTTRLRDQSKKLGAQVPEEVYTDIEDEAIQSVKPKNEGGKGLTEQQAIKEYGKKLHEISQDYQGIETLGGWGVTGRTAKDTFNSLNALRNSFEKRGDTKNFADTMTAKLGTSPMFSYAVAQPVANNPAANQTLRSLASLKPLEKTVAGVGENAPIINLPGGKIFKQVPEEIARDRTLKIMPRLARDMQQEGKKGLRPSPLAVAYELQKKGYSPEVFFDYLNKNREKLGLTGYQERQLEKPINRSEPWNDWWLGAWSGIDESDY